MPDRRGRVTFDRWTCEYDHREGMTFVPHRGSETFDPDHDSDQNEIVTFDPDHDSDQNEM